MTKGQNDVANTALKAVEPAMPTRQDAGAIMEQVIVKGDLKDLKPEERARYYLETCRSLGINPLVKPFEYITLNGKLTLYATRTATDQLRAVKNVSVKIVERRTENDLYVVVAQASINVGYGEIRQDESTGAVSIAGLKGDALANAYMKAETKAKRRVTLSICGLGFMDESELATVPGAVVVPVDMETGEIIETDPPAEHGAVSDERRTASRRYHAVCNDVGMSQDATALFAHAAGKVDSRQDLDAAQFHSLSDFVADALARLTDGAVSPFVDMANAIAAAESDAELTELRGRMTEADMLKPWLVEMGKRRRIELSNR
jgi:hypothetical protein